MQKTQHQPVPLRLPAHDIKRNLIKPEDCQKALAGTIARVHVTLTHWFINNGHEKKNLFVADIHSIRVLIGPLRQSMSPQKRKATRRDPGLGAGSVQKKMHRIGL